MPARTVVTTSDMVIYAVLRGGPDDEGAGFAIASGSTRQQRGVAHAALLAIRIQWFLKRNNFVWKKAKSATL
jgi:hypothetical protein